MKRMTLSILFLQVLVLIVSTTYYAKAMSSNLDMRAFYTRSIPKAPMNLLHYSAWRTAPLDIAKVFGRSPGCVDASDDVIEMTARAAIEANLNPSIAAATIAVESQCNPWAVSPRGAVGMMQIEAKVWHEKFDFSGDVNLFNPQDNIYTGSMILSNLINQYGAHAGLSHYNGVGPDAEAYAGKVLALAGK